MGKKRYYQNIIEHAMSELAKLDRFPDEDPFDDGTVISFVKQFVPGGTEYEYAALRCNNGQWFTTGPRKVSYAPWSELVDFLSEGVEDIYVVTEWSLVFDD